MKKIILTIIMFLAMASCTSERDMQRAQDNLTFDDLIKFAKKQSAEKVKQ